MTKEEIIEECNQRLGFETDCEMYSLCQHEKDFYNAIIKELEQQPNEDCVSRKAVLDILSHYAHNFGVDTEIKALSQVTPTHGTCKDCKYAEIHNGKLSEHCSVKCEPFCRKFLRFVSGENFYCADFEKRGNSDGSN